MANEVKMPQLSDTMHAGKILTWKKSVGDKIKRGDILAEVETDKANLEIESFQEGTLLEIRIPAEGNAAVGEVICVIGAAGETPTVKSAPAPSSNATSATNGSSVGAPSSTARSQMESAPPATAPTQHHAQWSGDRVIASPLARKMASDLHVDLSTLRGSGPAGRIVKRDIEQAAASHTPTTHAPAERSTAGGRLTPLSKMRDTIARRMQQSVTESPHFYVTVSVRMEQAVKLREVLKERPQYKGISINHLIMKACAYGLSLEPSVNASFKDGGVYQPDAINIGIITALPDGLIIPVIKNVDSMSLKDVVFESRAALERAKAGRPTSHDLTGGTFSISNMGMFDVDNFTAIISPGQGGVLAVSATKEEPVVEKGHVVPGLVMRATVSVDHRVIDGVMAARFLKYFKEALEQPALIMQ